MTIEDDIDNARESGLVERGGLEVLGDGFLVFFDLDFVMLGVVPLVVEIIYDYGRS